MWSPLFLRGMGDRAALSLYKPDNAMRNANPNTCSDFATFGETPTAAAERLVAARGRYKFGEPWVVYEVDFEHSHINRGGKIIGKVAPLSLVGINTPTHK